ncbi:protein phosphatase 1 regulatory subunit 21 isoform X2 [Anoplophora glabripennis]|uniref:protein phosphatase 1 regulatory subunit 21 isoform X2 n=1 Tax=Anoplophora glabripennis TaxID=217634 RepID=UPI0008735156|nr:protein phosphatase 1 regulatory subunit 21 isoform X2 [Anoplophora glabripennis]
MDRESDIETKYHKLATEYSKVRSQAAVLKKAVLDEQTKNIELTDLVKKHEQTMRKRDQEIESLVFRNEQLTKRIMVLQQDLQNNSSTKKNKNKPAEISSYNEVVDVVNEELQKKIVENAQLFNTVAERDLEIFDSKEKIKNLEESLCNLQKEYDRKETCLVQDKNKYETEIKQLRSLVDQLTSNTSTKACGKSDETNADFWKNEAERWKTECDFLRSKPDSSDKLTNYYELQLSKILEKNILLESEIKTLWADNICLKTRLEHVTSEHCKLKENIEVSYEELITTNKNYKSQLDAMTEHLAAQNEKIANQCDEIQVLRHKLSLKK